jgi:hypothetical protein
MKPEGSVPCPRKPATGIYPEPDESSPHKASHPISLRLIYIIVLSTPVSSSKGFHWNFIFILISSMRLIFLYLTTLKYI